MVVEDIKIEAFALIVDLSLVKWCITRKYLYYIESVLLIGSSLFCTHISKVFITSNVTTFKKLSVQDFFYFFLSI